MFSAFKRFIQLHPLAWWRHSCRRACRGEMQPGLVRPWNALIGSRGQREFSIPGILDESQLHFFSLDHEKWFSEVSISSRNMRVTKWNLVLVSKYENGHMIISISSRQARARKIILNLVSKNCTFSREWEWDSKSKPITVLHRRKPYDMIFDKQDHEYSTSHQTIWLVLGGTGSVEGCTRSVNAVRAESIWVSGWKGLK